MHLAGVGDFTIQELDPLPDPCPLPETVKKRGLSEKEKLLYAPMANVGGLLYDKDAVYIDIPDWKVGGGWGVWGRVRQEQVVARVSGDGVEERRLLQDTQPWGKARASRSRGELGQCPADNSCKTAAHFKCPC